MHGGYGDTVGTRELRPGGGSMKHANLRCSRPRASDAGIRKSFAGCRNLGDGGLNAARSGDRGRETGIIDLGHEPPLLADGSEAAVIDRRRIFRAVVSGTILTGLCGAALIGGAVFASLDGENLARVPERVEGGLRGCSEPVTIRPAFTRAIVCRRRARRPLQDRSFASRP